MLNITYAASEEQVARQLQTDLAHSSLKLEKPMLLVVASPAAVADSSVISAVQSAYDQGHQVVVMQAAPAELPTVWQQLPRFDISQGYEIKPLVRFLHRVDMGETRIRNSRILLGLMVLVIAIIFGASIWGIGTGVVEFPVDEYATDNAIREEMIRDLVLPTLDGWLPRSTQDALDFPMTVTAAPTRLRDFLAGTATALPQSVQGTLEAQSAAATGTVMALTASPEPEQTTAP